MTLDIIGRGDPDDRQGERDQAAADQGGARPAASAEDKAFYAEYAPPDFNSPFPWSQGPRRMGIDKNGDVLWVGASWGGSLARIDTKTQELSFVPLPGFQQPYHVAVDSQHHAWTNMWMTDRCCATTRPPRRGPRFDLPTRGTEVRYISLLEQNGQMQVVLPYSRTSKVAVMSFRSEADLAALKAQAAK